MKKHALLVLLAMSFVASGCGESGGAVDKARTDYVQNANKCVRLWNHDDSDGAVYGLRAGLSSQLTGLQNSGLLGAYTADVRKIRGNCYIGLVAPKIRL